MSGNKQQHQASTTHDAKCMEFATLYNQLKDKGYPLAIIRNEIMARFNIKKTRYYTYLRASREKGYITDSYEENIAKVYERNRVKFTQPTESKPSESASDEVHGSYYNEAGSATAKSDASKEYVVESKPTPEGVVLDAPKNFKKGFLSRIKNFLGIK